jgi:4-amino-4-deoxy-L-arabinose transferase-like glycosyltransferase
MFKRFESPARARTPGARPDLEWLLVFAVALVLRVAYAWIATGPHGQPYSDPVDYDTLAWNLARGAGFSLGSTGGLYPTAFRPPALPWITSLLYGAVGHRYFAAVLLQCVIGATVPLLVRAFGTAMFGGAVGRLGAWIAAIHPLLVFFCGYLLTEPLFCALMLLALAASASWVKTPRPGRALRAGLAWGLSSLARPTSLMLPGLVLLWAWVPLGLTIAPRDRVRQMLLLVLGLVLTVGPWTLRNALVLHAFVPVTTGGGVVLYVGNNPGVWGDPARRGGAGSDEWTALAAGEFRGLSEHEADVRARARALAFLREHARELPAMAAAKLARFWRLSAEGGGTGSWQRAGSPLARLLGWVDPLRIWSLFILPLAAWGAYRSFRGPRRWFQTLSVWVILYFTALGVVFFGSLRMRAPAEPLVALLAAAGLDDLWRRIRSRARGLRVVEGTR